MHRLSAGSRIAVVAIAAMVALAACGRSGSSNAGGGSGGSGGGGGSAKAPIKIMNIASWGNPIQDYPDVPKGAKAAVAAINKAGGVNGHKLELTTCNSQSDPNKVTNCAKQAVQGGYAAVVGQSDVLTTVSLPILKSGNVPSIGLIPFGNNIDMQSPISFPLNAGTTGAYMALPFGLKQLHRTRVAAAVADIPAAIQNGAVIKAAAKRAGIQYVGIVKMPTSGITDYAPYAAQLKAMHADAVIPPATPPQVQGLMKASASAGLNIVFAHSAINFGSVEASSIGHSADGSLLASPTLSSSNTNPGMKAFDSQMAAIGDPSPGRRIPTLNAWLSVYAASDVMKKISGSVTGASVLKQLHQPGSYDLHGLETFKTGGKGPDPSYPQALQSKETFLTIKGGKVVPTNLKPIDPLTSAGS